jgi:pentatricopeptide repeat protein
LLLSAPGAGCSLAGRQEAGVHTGPSTRPPALQPPAPLSAPAPARAGLTKLLSQLSREGSWTKALELFESLEAAGLAPDTTITNAAISACDRGGQWERALEIFDAMQVRGAGGLRGGAGLLGKSRGGARRPCRPPAGVPHIALRPRSTCRPQARGLPRDAITYSAAISALAKGRQWTLAIDAFDHMAQAGGWLAFGGCCLAAGRPAPLATSRRLSPPPPVHLTIHPAPPPPLQAWSATP